MRQFDVSKHWVILAPMTVPAVKTAAAELARCIARLRGPGGKKPLLADAHGSAPGEEVPLILLNAGEGESDQSGFTWRLGRDRVELHSGSGRGLCNGVFDFLAALGIRWNLDGREDFPPFINDGNYTLKDDQAYVSSPVGATERSRLALSIEDILKYGEKAARWAARNRIDALVLSLRDEPAGPAGLLGVGRRKRNGLFTVAAEYGLVIEAGGRDLSLLLPRRYFFTRRELFRMDGGKRVKDYNFCPTNPDTIRVLKQEAGKLFRTQPGIPVFHLRPDGDGERTWCSCPTCRAFSPMEQNRIAVNAVADTLAAINPAASIAFYEKTGQEGDIPLRPKLFALETLPGLEEFRVSREGRRS